ncbi:MAG TPA: ATP-binding cassette domain-containing protein, partial [Casimicrobiaceae bacterium]|nr:ATP-binding cassette domain-containing protein [Casimicrobiaceae bacterium]
GLTVEDELKSLRVIARLAAELPLRLVPTWLGAHEIPPEARSSDGARRDYMRLLVEEMLPRVAGDRLARFADVFCEPGVFTVDEARSVLTASRAAGLGLKLHADELSPGGGAELAAELRASSADHLAAISDAGVAALAATPRGHAEQARAPELLALRDVDAFYGKSHIVRGASLIVHEHEIVALLGRNGAGKSTLLKTIIGIVPAAAGAIALAGTDVAGRPAAETARRGIGYVPQGRALFAGMSVRHNLELGRLKRQGGTGTAWTEDKILAFFPRLAQRLDTPADYLSGGEQQMVAVARALSGHVRVLLLDEPFEGLAPSVVEELFEAFDKLRHELAIVIVEHNLDLVLALADHACVLERGSVIHDGPAAALRQDLALRKKVLWM